MKNSVFHSDSIQIHAFAGMTTICRSRESRNLSGGNLFQPARFIFETGPGRSAEIHATVEEQEPGVPAQMRDAPQTPPKTTPSTPAAVASHEAPPTQPPTAETPPGAREAAEAAVSKGAHAEQEALRADMGDPTDVATASFMEEFTARVREEGFDFEGPNNTKDEFEKNRTFQKAKTGLKAFFDENLPPGTPEKFSTPWLKASVKFMVDEIDKFSGMHIGEMNESNADDAIKNLKKNIGPFETWIQTQAGENSKQEYAEWKKQKETETAAAETVQKSLTEVKTALNATAAGLEAKIVALPAELVPTSIREGVTAAKQNIEAMTDAGKKAEIETTLATYTSQIAALEGLKEVAMHRGVMREKKTERDKILEELRAGTKTPEDAKIALDSLKKAAEEARRQKHETDDSVFGGITKFLSGWKIKFNLDGIAKMFVGWAAKGGFMWGIANYVVGKHALAANGDKKAQALVALEDKLYHLGIDDEITQKIEDEKPAIVVKNIRENPSMYTEDADQQQKLAALADKLDQNNATGSELALAEFAAANSGIFLELESGTAVAAATPTPAPAATPAATTTATPAADAEATPAAATDSQQKTA